MFSDCGPLQLPSPEELEEKILFEFGLDENYSGK